MGFYLTKFMGVYPDEFETFANMNAVGGFVLTLSTNALNGFLMTTWENEVMLKPGLCFIKAFADSICAYFIFA